MTLTPPCASCGAQLTEFDDACPVCGEDVPVTSGRERDEREWSPPFEAGEA